MKALVDAEAKLVGADALIAVCVGPREFILTSDEVFTQLTAAREMIAEARADLRAARKGGAS